MLESECLAGPELDRCRFSDLTHGRNLSNRKADVVGDVGSGGSLSMEDKILDALFDECSLLSGVAKVILAGDDPDISDGAAAETLTLELDG